MRFLLALIGYFTTATVITAASLIGYLWQTERLTDERMFQIVAVLHGVDIGGDMESSDENAFDETPPEEPSLVEEERLREIALRNQEVRLASLERGRVEFDHALEQLASQTDRFNNLAEELQQRLEQETAENAEEGVRTVVRDIKEASPELGKELLLRVLENGTTAEEKQRALADTIRLIRAMPLATWSEIVNTIDGEEEISQLHRIHMEELEGGAKRRVLDDAIRQLHNRDFRE